MLYLLLLISLMMNLIIFLILSIHLMLINGLYAKHDELSSLIKNRTWILIKNSKDIKVIGFRWLFIKRMVLRIIFSPVVRIIFSLIFQFDLLLKQIDTKLTFFMMTQIRNLYETISHKVF